MNDRADALAQQGSSSEEPPRWPGPRKTDPLSLSARETVRDAHAPFPDRNVPDQQLIRRAMECAELRAARIKATTCSREMLRDPLNCGDILKSIAGMRDSAVRLWMQTVTGQYPTKARLHKMFPGKFPSAACPWCQRTGVDEPETLCHFLTVCPRFREARTEAHNQCWKSITQALGTAMPPDWHFFHDKPMRTTGLLCVRPAPEDRLGSDVGALEQRAGVGEHSLPGLMDHGGSLGSADLYNLRPDTVAVHHGLKKIAILEHCRPYDGADREQPDTPLDPTPSPGEEPVTLAVDPTERPPDSAIETRYGEFLVRVGRNVGEGGCTNSSAVPGEDEVDASRGLGSTAPRHAGHDSRGGTRATAEAGEQITLHPADPSTRGRIRDARMRKHVKYKALADVLRRCHPGWQVEVLPWVVGVRGVVDATGIQHAMTFLGVPVAKRGGLVRRSAVASVESLVYMHRVRSSGASRIRIDLARERRPLSGTKKRRRGGDDAGENMVRWRRLGLDPARRNRQGMGGRADGDGVGRGLNPS